MKTKRTIGRIMEKKNRESERKNGNKKPEKNHNKQY